MLGCKQRQVNESRGSAGLMDAVLEAEVQLRRAFSVVHNHQI